MYRHPQINKFHFFEAFRFLLVKSNLERGGGGGGERDSFTPPPPPPPPAPPPPPPARQLY